MAILVKERKRYLSLNPELLGVVGAAVECHDNL